MIVISVEFIDQLINYPINRASLSVCIFLICSSSLLLWCFSGGGGGGGWRGGGGGGEGEGGGGGGGLCFVIVAFPGYLHIYFSSPNMGSCKQSIHCFGGTD